MKLIKQMNKKSGQVVIITALFFLLISSAIVTSVSSVAVSQIKSGRDLEKTKNSFFLAESANEDVFYRVKNNLNVSLDETLSLNGGNATTVVSDVESGIKEITSVSDLDGRIRTVKTRVRISSGTSFSYGLYSGQGGIDFDSNTRINGSIYSNGNITGASNVIISGDVFVANQVSTNTNAQWIVNNSDYIFGKVVSGENRIDVAQSFTPTSSAYLAKVGLNLKKVGTTGNLSVKVVGDNGGAPDVNNVIASGSMSASLAGENYSYVQVGFDVNPQINAGTTYWIVVDMIESTNNYYVWGIDTNAGYSSGVAKYSNNWSTGSFTNISGDLDFKIWTSAFGQGGSINNVSLIDEFGRFFSAHAHTISNTNVTGDIYAYDFSGGSVGRDIFANSISDCSVVGNASYNTKSSCSIGGTETTPTTPPNDPVVIASPISDANIETWKADSIAGGVISNTNFTPSNGQTIGPGVIYGNLTVGQGNILNISGNVYVTGNVTINKSADIKLVSSGSAMIISDGWVFIDSSARVNSPRLLQTHLMVLSLAACDNILGYLNCNADTSAISARNSVEVDILAAPNGIIRMDSNVLVISLTGSRLDLRNNIILNYEQGLSNMNFSSGPGGTWVLEDWKE